MGKPAKPKPRPDRIDMRILAAVADKGRQTITDLSKAVGLSQSPCAARLDRLEADQIILAYHAELDVDRIADLSLYYVTISVEPYNADTAAKIEAYLSANPYVASADALFGKRDYLARIYARSTPHYYEILAPLIALADCETWPISRTVVRPQIHRLIGELKRNTA